MGSVAFDSVELKRNVAMTLAGSIAAGFGIEIAIAIATSREAALRTG